MASHVAGLHFFVFFWADDAPVEADAMPVPGDGGEVGVFFAEVGLERSEDIALGGGDVEEEDGLVWAEAQMLERDHARAAVEGPAEGIAEVDVIPPLDFPGASFMEL